MFTTQMAYEAIRAWFTRPGAKRAVVAGEDSCVYRKVIDGELLCCAVGCLIPPALYDESMEHKLWRTAIQASLHADILKQLFAGVDGNFLSEVQQAHDVPTEDINIDNSVEAFVRKLDEIAKKHDLTLVTS